MSQDEVGKEMEKKENQVDDKRKTNPKRESEDI